MLSPLAAWDGALHRISAELPQLALKAWILPLGIRAEGSTLVLAAPNAFHLERVRSRYLALIESQLACEAGAAVPVRLEVGECASAEPARRLAVLSPAPEPREAVAVCAAASAAVRIEEPAAKGS